MMCRDQVDSGRGRKRKVVGTYLRLSLRRVDKWRMRTGTRTPIDCMPKRRCTRRFMRGIGTKTSGAT